MKILAIDPGPEESAALIWDGESVSAAHMMPSEHCLGWVRSQRNPIIVAVEMVACYGMPVGKEVFETVLLIGRIQEAVYMNCLEGVECRLIYRQDVKMHLCQSMRAKDANIRQALIDRFGKPGTKKNPGKLYGISNHLWSALAIAVTAADKINPQKDSQ